MVMMIVDREEASEDVAVAAASFRIGRRRIVLATATAPVAVTAMVVGRGDGRGEARGRCC